MIKVILCFVVIGLCGFIGYGVSNYYIQRKKFFFSNSNFLNTLKTDISFSAKKLEKIIKENFLLQNLCKNYKIMLQNFLNCLEQNEQLEKENLFKGITILSEQEKESIYCFFKKLGKLDSLSQIEEIDKVFNVNNGYYEQAKDDSKKYSTLYIKLGIIIGAFVALMIS